MVSKTIKICLAFMALIQTVSFAQSSSSSTDDSWVFDSSKISSKNMPQHNEFMNYQNPYPAKPRNMIELGFSGGYNRIIGGDVFAVTGFGGGISLRKALGHVISLRGSWEGSFNYGLDGHTARYDAGFGNYTPWTIYDNAEGSPKYVLNYKNATHMLNLDVIASINNMSHYRGNPKWDWYFLLGAAAWSSDVDVDAVNGSGNRYDFSSISFDGANGKDNRSRAKDILDGKYESNAPWATEDRTNSYSRFDDNQLIGVGANIGMGLAFKINDRFNIGLEQKFTVSFNDYLDGVSSAAGTTQGISNDAWSATHLRLNINLGNASKSIQPLWWINPNNYLYNEISNPKHLKWPPIVLPDADGDGVTDQFDMEANTPAGCPVDSHGVTKDTDGDGVPDCRDKEILTQQSCFPVDADGVGKCPDPACCTTRVDPPACTLTSLPSITFKAGSASLSASAKSLLNSAAASLNANPACNVKVIGYGASDKRSQQLSWDRVNAVIKYLSETQGISESRFIFSNGNPGGNVNTVDLQPTTETGPNTVTPPFPQYRKTN